MWPFRNLRYRPARRRVRIGPRWLHLVVNYVLFSRNPRITSIAVQHDDDYTHNFRTGRNTLTFRDIGSLVWGDRRRSRRRR